MLRIRKDTFLLFALLFAATLLRVIWIETLPAPIHIDESFMTHSAISLLEGTRHIFDTYFSISVIGNLPTAIFIYFFEVEVWSIRLQSIIFGSLTVAFSYLLAKSLFNKRVAIFTLVLVGSSHVMLAYSRANFPNIQAAFLLVSTLYFAHIFSQKKHYAFHFFIGSYAGLSLYSYTGAKIILPIALLFLVLFWKLRYWRRYLFFFLGALCISAPLIFYTVSPESNFTERENQVSIFSNPQIFYDAWDTTSIPEIVIKQYEKNFLSFLILRDNSNQYGNTALLDPLSATLFVFFIILILIRAFRRKMDKINIFFLFVFLFTLLLVSFTESPPLSTRLLVVVPIVLIFIAQMIAYLHHSVSRQRLLKAVPYIVLFFILFLNIKFYFFDYTTKNRAYYNWIEPNSSIALLAKNTSKDVYILSNPHTYSLHSIITAFSYKKRSPQDISPSQIRDLMSENDNVIILPVEPQEATLGNGKLLEDITPYAKELDRIIRAHTGVPCIGCSPTVIFYSISHE